MKERITKAVEKSRVVWENLILQGDFVLSRNLKEVRDM